MEKKEFYLKTSAAFLCIVLAATSLISGNYITGAPILILAGVFLTRNAEKSSRKYGRTDRMKTVLKGLRPGGELILISAGLIAYSTSTASTAAVLGFVALSMILEESLSSDSFFGQDIRIGLLFFTFTAFIFNEYALFYGLVAVGLVGAVDSGYMLFKNLDASS